MGAREVGTRPRARSSPVGELIAAVGGAAFFASVSLAAGWVRASRPEGLLVSIGSGAVFGALVVLLARSRIARPVDRDGIERFNIEREVAKGGMGIVHHAIDRATGTPVALKLLLGLGEDRLTYNRGDLVGDGCLEPRDGGLTRFGRDMVAGSKSGASPGTHGLRLVGDISRSASSSSALDGQPELTTRRMKALAGVGSMSRAFSGESSA